MPESTIWTHDTTTGRLRLERIGDDYHLSGEFEGRTQELASGPDLRALVMSLASSPDISPFMEGIKALRNQGEAHHWDLSEIASTS